MPDAASGEEQDEQNTSINLQHRIDPGVFRDEVPRA